MPSPVVSGFLLGLSGSKKLGSSIPTLNRALPPLISCRGRRPLGACLGRGNLWGGPSSTGDGGPSSVKGLPSMGETGRGGSSGVLAFGALSSGDASGDCPGAVLSGDSSGDCPGGFASEGSSTVGFTCGVLISEILTLPGAFASGPPLMFGRFNLGRLIFGSLTFGRLNFGVPNFSINFLIAYGTPATSGTPSNPR